MDAEKIKDLPSETPVAPETPAEKIPSSRTEIFYDDLTGLEDETHYPEAVEIYDIMDWQSFPDELRAETTKEDEESIQKTKQTIRQLQSFGKYAEEKPPDESDMRDVGADDRLKLGDRYNSLVSTYRRISERSAKNGQPISQTLRKKFCHELASIIHDYEECKELWKIIGERALGQALDAYADIKGVNAVSEDLGEEIPEQIDRYTIMPLIRKINDMVRRDWQQKITPVESFQEGGKYSFICSRVVQPFVAKERKNGIFSCSLLTESHHKTVGSDDRGNYGFILPPDHIIAAAPYDLYAHNWTDDDEHSARMGPPVIMSYDRVLRESKQNETFSEITTRDLPIGIFYIKDKISEEERKKLEQLAKMNPELPIIAL